MGRGGHLNGAAVYAAPDEVPPAAPRRLVSRHNTPSRPERSGAKSGNSGDGGDDGGKLGGAHRMSLADPNAMDAGGGGAGVLGVSQGYQLAAHGYYAKMSPVTVAPGRGGFPGGRRHHRHHSSGNQQGSNGVGSLAEGGRLRASTGWVGDVSPEEAILRGDSPSSSRSGGGGGAGIMGGLGLTAHAMSRMEQV